MHECFQPFLSAVHIERIPEKLIYYKPVVVLNAVFLQFFTNFATCLGIWHQQLLCSLILYSTVLDQSELMHYQCFIIINDKLILTSNLNKWSFSITCAKLYTLYKTVVATK